MSLPDTLDEKRFVHAVTQFVAVGAGFPAATPHERYITVGAMFEAAIHLWLNHWVSENEGKVPDRQITELTAFIEQSVRSKLLTGETRQ